MCILEGIGMEDGGIEMGGIEIKLKAHSLIPLTCPIYFSWCILGLWDALDAIESRGVLIEAS